MVALRFVDVIKRFGSAVALDAFTAEAPVGSVVGLIGPNGAGKTTAFSLVGGFLKHDAGLVEILGEPNFDPHRLKGRLGLLPQDAELGDRHTPRELCDHLARLQGMTAKAAAPEAERVLDLVKREARRDARIGTLSHGMRRRVALATALLGDPALVLLDEPTAGLDPVQADGVREVLRTRPRGQTVVISSHNLAELERMCDWVIMMDRGRCTRQGPIDDVTGRTEVVEWRLASAAPVAAVAAALVGFVVEVDADVLRVTAPARADLDAASLDVMRVLVAHGVAVRDMRRGVGLERRFFQDQGRSS